MPQNALQQGGNALGAVGVQIPAPRNAAHQGGPSEDGIKPVYYAASDPTINDGVNLGIYPGTRWINSATKCMFENIDNAVGAAIWRFVPQFLAVSNTVSITATSVTTEVKLGSVLIPANAAPVGSRLRVRTMWLWSSSGNAKQLRYRLGPNDDLTGDIFFSASLTTSIVGMDERDILVTAAAAQKGSMPTVAFGAFTVSGLALPTGTTSMAAPSYLVFSGQSPSTTDSSNLSGYTVELVRPDIGPT